MKTLFNAEDPCAYVDLPPKGNAEAGCFLGPNHVHLLVVPEQKDGRSTGSEQHSLFWCLGFYPKTPDTEQRSFNRAACLFGCIDEFGRRKKGIVTIAQFYPPCAGSGSCQ